MVGAGQIFSKTDSTVSVPLLGIVYGSLVKNAIKETFGNNLDVTEVSIKKSELVTRGFEVTAALDLIGVSAGKVLAEDYLACKKFSQSCSNMSFRVSLMELASGGFSQYLNSSTQVLKVPHSNDYWVAVSACPIYWGVKECLYFKDSGIIYGAIVQGAIAGALNRLGKCCDVTTVYEAVTGFGNIRDISAFRNHISAFHEVDIIFRIIPH